MKNNLAQWGRGCCTTSHHSEPKWCHPCTFPKPTLHPPNHATGFKDKHAMHSLMMLSSMDTRLTRQMCVEHSPCTVTGMPLTVRASPTSTSSMLCSQTLTILLWSGRGVDCWFGLVVRLIVNISQFCLKFKSVAWLSQSQSLAHERWSCVHQIVHTPAAQSWAHSSYTLSWN